MTVDKRTPASPRDVVIRHLPHREYSFIHWRVSSRYGSGSRLPIDDNPVDNVTPLVAIGKEPAVDGSERARKRAAENLTFQDAMIRNDLDLAAWRRETLEKLPPYLNRRIDSAVAATYPRETPTKSKVE